VQCILCACIRTDVREASPIGGALVVHRNVQRTCGAQECSVLSQGVCTSQCILKHHVCDEGALSFFQMLVQLLFCQVARTCKPHRQIEHNLSPLRPPLILT